MWLPVAFASSLSSFRLLEPKIRMFLQSCLERSRPMLHTALFSWHPILPWAHSPASRATQSLSRLHRVQNLLDITWVSHLLPPHTCFFSCVLLFRNLGTKCDFFTSLHFQITTKSCQFCLWNVQSYFSLSCSSTEKHLRLFFHI